MPEITCTVLGATGFIGGQIVRAALERGWRVRGVRRRPGAVGALDDVAERVEWVQADLIDPVSLIAAMRGAPLVFHAAAYYPQRAHDPWPVIQHSLAGMRNVLAAARSAGVRRIVYTSTLSTVGPPGLPGRLANEDDLYMPGSVGTPYFEAKWMMEQEVMRACAAGMDAVVVIPSTVFGPGDVKPTTSALMIQVARRRMPVFVAGSINVVDGRDVARGQIRAAERGKSGRRYILGGHNMSIEQMLATIAQAAGVRPPRIKFPLSLAGWLGRMGAWLGIPFAGQLQAIRHWQALDGSRAQQELGLPEPRPFEQTCQDTLEWFRSHGYLAPLEKRSREEAE
ncbi:MAG: NAD-dependent epimerase/dehydratase family protein [Anaerolineae bacterium]|nr:NAD-dependent epimerase/dehydratase family protein [Anaerolineae bacterium]